MAKHAQGLKNGIGKTNLANAEKQTQDRGVNQWQLENFFPTCRRALQEVYPQRVMNEGYDYEWQCGPLESGFDQGKERQRNPDVSGIHEKRGKSKAERPKAEQEKIETDENADSGKNSDDPSQDGEDVNDNDTASYQRSKNKARSGQVNDNFSYRSKANLFPIRKEETDRKQEKYRNDRCQRPEPVHRIALLNDRTGIKDNGRERLLKLPVC